MAKILDWFKRKRSSHAPNSPSLEEIKRISDLLKDAKSVALEQVRSINPGMAHLIESGEVYDAVEGLDDMGPVIVMSGPETGGHRIVIGFTRDFIDAHDKEELAETIITQLGDELQHG